MWSSSAKAVFGLDGVLFVEQRGLVSLAAVDALTAQPVGDGFGIAQQLLLRFVLGHLLVTLCLNHIRMGVRSVIGSRKNGSRVFMEHSC